MICILTGHTPIEVKGTGRYAGRTAILCEKCGKPLDETQKAAPPRGYEAVAEEHFRGQQ